MNREQLEKKNLPYNSKWLFPVRMENSRDIRWVSNIVEAFGKFNRPITRAIWERCLRTGNIAAETPEENKLLWEWWDKGWQEMPTLAKESDKGTPVLQFAATPLGDTLEVVYPTMKLLQKDLEMQRTQFYRVVTNRETDGIHWYQMLRQTSAPIELDNDRTKWTVFTPDNIIAGRFRTKLEMAEFLGCSRKQVDVTIATDDHQFYGGYWLWKDDWGFTPITPKGEQLPVTWRTDCLPKQD